MSGRQSLGRQAKDAARKRLAKSSLGKGGNNAEKEHLGGGEGEEGGGTKHEDYVYTQFFTRLSNRRMTQLGLPLMLAHVGKRTKGTYGNRLSKCYKNFVAFQCGLTHN